ncbi:MAG: aminotransferase class V-fold PLP-dependent enzyme, partial [Planctomycetota bacterium]
MREGCEDRPALLGGAPVCPQGPPPWPPSDPAVESALRDCFASGDWGRYAGRFTERLRRRLSEEWGVRHVRLMCSGTAAVEAALRAVPVRAGDEVIVAAYDFKANFINVLQLGATPVLVDVLAEDWQIDPRRVAAACSPKTRAVIVSHLHGGVAAVREIVAFARPRGIAVIEDACQAAGCPIDGAVAGTIGDVGVVSFGGSKTLSAGRGGAVFTDDDGCAQRIRLWDERGNRACPLSELQAAAVLPQLERLEERNRRRWQAAARLCRALADVPGLRPLIPAALLQGTSETPSAPVTIPGLYKLGFRFVPEVTGVSADLFSRAVRAEGVALDRGFAGLHRIHARRRFRAPEPLPNADRAHRDCLVLHHPVLLEPPERLEAVE